jgi:hypothetical protein
MVPLLYLTLHLSTPLHAQTEREQKQAKVIEQRQRSQPRYNPNTNTNRNQTRPYTRLKESIDLITTTQWYGDILRIGTLSYLGW